MKNFDKVIFLIFLFVFIFKISSFSQYYYYNNNYYDNDIIVEIGGSIGEMQGAADVGRKNFSPLLLPMYDLKSTKTNSSIYIGILYQNIVGARIEYTRGNVAGADRNSNVDYYKTRNLSYKSYIHELSLIGEFHPLMLKSYDNLPKYSPYIMAGIGFFSFNPQTLYKGKWVDLQPLHTEGQGFKEFPDRKPYSLNAVSFPIGVGMKYELSPFFNLRLEVLYRFTSTNYLDDVSRTSYFDPNLFSKNSPAKEASIDAALSSRYKDVHPDIDLIGNGRGVSNTNDRYLTFNLKFGLALGRQRIK